MRHVVMALLLTGAATSVHAVTPTLSDSMAKPFSLLNEGWGGAPIPDDGLMHVDGTWGSPYCQGVPQGNIAQANTSWNALQGRTVLSMTVHANTCDAAEIASDKGWSFNGGQSFPYGQTGYGYGYYEVVMMTSAPYAGSGDGLHGTVESFFIRGAQGNSGNLVNPEMDFEFTTDESWHTTGNTTGNVHLSATGISGDAISKGWALPFNPSSAFHHYGFLWQAGSVAFYVDGNLITTYTLGDLTNPTYGVIIMANNWTGIRSWGGLPPRQNETAYYRHVKYYAGVTSRPSGLRIPTVEIDPASMVRGPR